MQQPEGFKPQRKEGRHPGQSDWVRDLCLRVSTVPARPGRPLFAVRRLPHANPQVDRQCFSRNRTSAVPMQTTHGKHTVDEPLRVCIGQRTRRVRGPAWKDDRPDRPCEGVRPDRDSELRENVSCPAKLIESGGCCRRILARQGDPWTWDGRVPWGNGSAPLVLLRSAWRCGTSWLRPARRAMQWHAGGPGARRVWFDPRGFAVPGLLGMTRPESTSLQVKGASRRDSCGRSRLGF